MNSRVEGGASLSAHRLMWVSERTLERNSPLFDTQLSDRPSGLQFKAVTLIQYESGFQTLAQHPDDGHLKYSRPGDGAAVS